MLAAVLLAVSVLLGVLAYVAPVFPGDRPVSALARALGPAFAPIATVFNEHDFPIALGLIVAAATILLRGREWEAAAVTVAVAVIRPVLGLPKAWIGRPRPEGTFDVLDMVDTAAFPSGHTMTAAVALGVWFVYAPALVGDRWSLLVRGLAVVGVALMAVARMWAGVHWFSDTYGAVVWIAALFVTVMLLARLAHTWIGARGHAEGDRG